MIRTLFGLAGLVLLSSSGFGQSSTPFKSYKTQEDYCRENPQMPTCIHVDPIDLQKGLSGALYKPPKTTTSTPRTHVNPEPAPVAQIPLQDWRFSHPSPAMLLSINIGSLLRSPLLTSLFASSGAAAADIEKARAALSDVGQVLISVTANGTASPSVLMMAKGNIDGVFGALFRSGTEMQAKRLDAITLLIGDPVSMRMADLRMRSPFTRSTTNSLQQTATREALKYDAWIGIDPRHLASVASVFGAASTPGLSGLGNLLGLSAGLYLRDQIRLEASLDTPSAELAERMLAAFEKSRQPDQVWVSTEGAKVRFIQIVEAKSLKSLPGFDPQLMGSKIAPLIQSLAASNVGAQSANAGPSKPTGAIVIQGLSAK